MDLRSVKKSHAEVAHIYKTLGFPDRLHFSVAPGPHAYCRQSREAMYGFFTSEFMGKEDPEEPEFELLTDEEAQVTPTGFTIDLPGALTETQAVLAALPDTEKVTVEKISSFLRSSLALSSELPVPPDYRVSRNCFLAEGFSAARFVLMPEPGTTLRPVLKIAVQTETPLIPEGTTATLHCAHLSAQEELRDRHREKNLFVLDVRGIGESRSSAGRGAPDNFFAPVGRDSFVEGTAELLGVPLAGGKVRDLLSAVALLKAHGYTDLTLSGRGMGGIIAAFAAAAIELPIKKLILDQVPISLKKLIEKRIFRVPNSCLPKGMLQHLDFPELYKALKSRYEVELITSEDVPEDAL